MVTSDGQCWGATFSLLSENCRHKSSFTLDLDVFRGASFGCDQAVVKPTARGGNEAKQRRKTPNIK